MAKRILQVNFKMNVPYANVLQANREPAKMIAQTPGLNWKIWLANEDTDEAGGLYLFDDEASAEAYLKVRTPQWESSPAIGEIKVKQFDVVDELTEITRGPI